MNKKKAKEAAVVDRGDLTRDRIIGAATTLFSRKGFNNTRLSEILSEANITKGGFYFHFESKKELGLAVIDNVVRVWVDRVLAGAVREKNPFLRIQRMFELEDKLAAETDATGYSLIAVLTAEMTDNDVGFMDRLCLLFEEWHGSVKRMIENGQQKGVFRQDVDPDGLAMLLVAAMQGVSLLSQLDRSGVHYKHMMKSLRKHLQHLLIP